MVRSLLRIFLFFASHVLVYRVTSFLVIIFKSEVSCGGPIASASWVLLPGGELCSILVHDICLRCAAMVYPCTRFFVFVLALFLFSHTNFDNFCGSLQQLFF